MRYSLLTLARVLALMALAVTAAAQDPSIDTPPTHVAFVDGTATLDRDTDVQPVSAGVPLVPGDRLRTERGRVELLFPEGSALDLDESTSVELLSPDRLRLADGRILLTVTGAANPDAARSFHIDTQVAGVDTSGPGEYRVSLFTGRFGLEVELAVVRGSAALTGDRGTVALSAGQVSTVAGGGMPTYPQRVNASRHDPFERWAADRRDERRGAASAQYLPPDLRMYSGALEQNGSWQYEQSYGYVWYPTVAADWRPYYDGYWSSVPHYGWTWVGAPRWAWPTHHYGRWGMAGARWFWIPERRFAPAWVSWGAAPGYVGWCPLGFDNRPVFALSAAFGTPYGSVNAWVTLPREHFGKHHDPVYRYAKSPRQLPARTPWVGHSAPPIAPPRAAAHRITGTPPASADRRVAVPRTDASAADRRWQMRNTPSASTTGPARVRSGADANQPAPDTTRTYQPTRRHLPASGDRIQASPSVGSETLPVYRPRPVTPATYGVQDQSAPGGAVRRHAPAAGSGPGDAGDRSHDRGRAVPRAPRGEAAPASPQAPQAPPDGTAGARRAAPAQSGGQAQGRSRAQGAGQPQTTSPSQGGPASSGAPASQRGHRAR